jgi:hypothetical protein
MFSIKESHGVHLKIFLKYKCSASKRVDIKIDFPNTINILFKYI